MDGNVGAWGFARGGMSAITQALARSLAASGGEVRAGFGVDRILVQGGRAVALTLANGDMLRGRRVISNMDVKRTALHRQHRADGARL